MKIPVIGTSYTGPVSGTCLAKVGNDVLCLDIDTAKIKTFNICGIPIFESGLNEQRCKYVAIDRNV